MAKSIVELIGNTPLVRLSNIETKYGLNFKLYAKLEMCNPTGSAKDRVARQIVLDAIERGRLLPGGTIVEPTSGNTGIGLAAVAAAWGYRARIFMPDTMSAERRNLLTAYGAELELTPGSEGMAGAVARAQQYVADNDGCVLAGQFSNPANVAAHMLTTGPEIYEQTGGSVDACVAGIGTGGTISGVGRYLKSRRHDVRIVGVEPAASPLLTEGWAAAHGIQGIGANFVPDILDRTVINHITTATDQESMELARELCRCEGIFAGISSGAALSAALALAEDPALRNGTVVVILPDSGDRYLSCCLWA